MHKDGAFSTKLFKFSLSVANFVSLQVIIFSILTLRLNNNTHAYFRS